MHRQALAAVEATRPAIARLDRSRTANELSADLTEAWAGIETALRALLGGAPLSGQQLIREARQRHMLTFDQANALAAFHAARDRAQLEGFQPTPGDIDAARDGFLKFEASLMMPPGEEHEPPGEAMSTKGLRLSPLGTPRPVKLPPERQPWRVVVVAILILAGLVVGVWMVLMRGKDRTLDRAVGYWKDGRRELAVAEFERAARENPQAASAHVYLSRMAREGGDIALAREHATVAVRAEPANGLALRELASAVLASGDYELARRFYVRAVEASPDDRLAQGYLGCTLLKLGRTDEGTRWLDRAGQGSWNECAGPAAPTLPPRTR